MLSTPKEKNNLKIKVKEFWNEQSCGEVYAKGLTEIESIELLNRNGVADVPLIS